MQIVRPSGSLQWGKCYGSHVMQTFYPDTDSDAAMEGTACHEMAAALVSSFAGANKEPTTAHHYVGKLATNGVLFTEEMYEAVREYVTDILMYCNQHGTLRDLHIEKTMPIDAIYQGMVGTPDCWLVNYRKQEIIVWDLKYGHGLIEIFENPQFINYGSGIRDLLRDVDNFTVKFRVIQPRGFHSEGTIREWATSMVELRPYFNKLHYAASMAMTEGALCTPGTQCHYCTAHHACPALQQSVYMAIDMLGMPIPMELSGNNLSFELMLVQHAAELIKYRKTALEEQAIAEIKNGTVLPGYEMVPTMSRKNWLKSKVKSEIAEVAMSAFKIDIAKPVDLKTPTQAIAMGLNETFVDGLSERYVTGVKLKLDDGTKARQIFRKEN